jgi:uncharacterized membrane protein
MDEKQTPLITNDAVVLGILFLVLAFVFITNTSKRSGWVKFYKVVPSVLLCYFIPALLNTFNVISGEQSQLYPVASRYFLPASLILLTLSVDIPALKKLGPKALIMFFAASIGVMIGGPVALMIAGSISPGLLVQNNEEVWRGLSTIAGSWIGGGANQAAMLEVFGASKTMFGQMVAIDVLVAYIWMGLLLYGTNYNDRINKWLKADTTAITTLEKRMQTIDVAAEKKKAGTREIIILLGVALGVTGFSHFAADLIAPFFATHFPGSKQYSLTSSFFWLVSIATLAGLALSFTRVKKLEAYGASEFGSVFLYFLIAAIGMNMNLKALFTNPALLLVAAMWILFHIIIMLVVAKIIRAPYFFVAVGSQANIGGPASAPIVAAVFNKYLAPVGVLLAVLGYAVGTYAAYLCGLAMQYVSNVLR